MTEPGPRGLQGDTGATGGVGQTGATGSRGSTGKEGKEGPAGSGAQTPASIEVVLKELRGLLKIFGVMAVMVTGYAVWLSYDGRNDSAQAERRGCERDRIDRRANADSWTAHLTYLRNVTAAASVKQDVKRAARDAIEVYERTAMDLQKVASISCDDQYPGASLVP
jgi:hypothetical protein